MKLVMPICSRSFCWALGLLFAVECSAQPAAPESSNHGGYVDVASFGAKNDSTTDSTSAIQAALNTGKSIILPGNAGGGGTSACYLISAPLVMRTSGQQIVGSGFSSCILTSGVSADLIQLGVAGGAEVDGIRISNLRFWATTKKTGGAVIRAIVAAGRPTFDNLFIGDSSDYNAGGNRLYDGILLNENFGEATSLNNIITVQHDGIALARGSEAHILGTTIVNCTAGVHMTGGAGGVYLDAGTNISACATNVLTDMSVVKAANRELFIGPTASLDVAKEYDLRVSAGSLVYLLVRGTYFGQKGGATSCASIERPAATGFIGSFIGGFFTNCQHNAIDSEDGVLVALGNQIHLAGASGDGAGIYVDSTQGSTISGNRIGECGPNGAGGRGINIGGRAANVIVHGNDLSNCSIPVALNGAAAPAIRVLDNLASGVVSVLASGEKTPRVEAGKGASIKGTDAVGRIIVGAPAPTAIVLTFANSWSNPPVCLAQDETSNVSLRATSTSRADARFEASAPLTVGDNVSFQCAGYN